MIHMNSMIFLNYYLVLKKEKKEKRLAEVDLKKRLLIDVKSKRFI